MLVIFLFYSLFILLFISFYYYIKYYSFLSSLCLHLSSTFFLFFHHPNSFPHCNVLYLQCYTSCPYRTRMGTGYSLIRKHTDRERMKETNMLSRLESEIRCYFHLSDAISNHSMLFPILDVV